MADASPGVQAELTRASALIKQHKVDEAEAIFTGLLRSPLSSADGMYGLGVVAFLRKDLATAGDWMRHSLQLRPQHANTVYYLGVIAERSDPSHDSSKLYEEALRIDPSHSAARARLNQLRGSGSDIAKKWEPSNSTQDAKRPSAPTGGISALLDAPPPANASTAMPAVDVRTSAIPPSFYQALVQDKSALGMQTRRLIDEIQSTRVRPALSAYAWPILAISVSWLIVLALFAMSPLGQRTVYGTDSLIAAAPADTMNPAPLADEATSATSTELNMPGVLLLGTLGLLTIGYLVLRIRTTLMSFDHGRVALARGVFHRSMETHELLRVHDVSIHRTLFNRLTGDGSLILQLTAGQAKHAETIKLRGYAKNQRLQELMIQIRDLVLLLRSGPWGKGVIY